MFMKILVLNCGSSSLKCYLYHFSSLPKQPIAPLWEAHLQWKNRFASPFLKIKNHLGQQDSKEIRTSSTTSALKQLIHQLYQGKTAILDSLDEVDVIGHRIVHGGKFFKETTYINAKVKAKIRLLNELAPLHNLADLEGIEVMEALFKNKPQFAVFDTAFHHTLPKEAAVYPGPYKWYKEGIQRYGFHGISFGYCAWRSSALLKQELKEIKLLICHLGSGASLCAVKEGISIDTTMGFTPLEGLMMDTRSGSVDPGILLYLLNKKKISPKTLYKILYHESGLLGISGISSDMRDILMKESKGDPRAALTLEIYLHRLSSLIGSMIASLKGIDTLVFTAGIGENAPLIRKRICQTFSFLGLTLDESKNALSHSEDAILSSADSKVKILLIHTQEAFEIARECWKKLSKK